MQGKSKEELLAQAHVFCLPTYYSYEGQPISILEAYASGCAVLTTDHSGIFDIFTPGMNGWQVRPQSPESIVEVLVEIAAAPVVAAQIGQWNRQQAEQNYTRSEHLRALYTAIGLSPSA